jgi:hypothetical protein
MQRGSVVQQGVQTSNVPISLNPERMRCASSAPSVSRRNRCCARGLISIDKNFELRSVFERSGNQFGGRKRVKWSCS